MGNNFGYSAFVRMVHFWIGLCIIKLLGHYGIYESERYRRWFLPRWLDYLYGHYVCGLVSCAHCHGVTFGTLLLGFILLDLEHFGFPELKTLAAIDLIICAGAAWYMMAGIIINDLAGKTVLPMGKN
jgi:uncharacterized protein